MHDELENEGFDDECSGSQLNEESTYICDSCGEEIVVPIDYSQGSRQEYVEDCPVCCNPNVIIAEISPDGSVEVWGRAEQDPM